jgi:ABC-type branched-subunit amino acid transport system ATPase component/ABC-type branched-subunit amino acid transport system permease subunit
VRARARGLAWAGLLLLPLIFRGDLSRFALARVATFCVAATGISLVSGIGGQISLGHAALMAAGAYTSAGLAVHAGWPFAGAWAAGTALAALLGLAFGAPSLRVRGQYLALATLGGGFIVWEVIRETGSLTGSDFGLADVPPPSFVGHALGPLGVSLLALGLLAAALAAVGSLQASRAGRALRAVRDVEVGAAACGVSVYRAKLAAFVASAVLAGAAGGLLAHAEGFIAAGQFDPRQSLALLVAAVLGGLASPLGGALGGLLMLGPQELFPAAFAWLDRYQLLAWGPVALVVVLRWPEGVAGALARLAQRLGRRPRPAIGAAGSAGPTADARALEVPGPAGGGAAGSARPDAPLLVVEGLVKTFGGVRALGGVSLEVRVGEIHALIGPNGSGKTTLLDCVTGLSRPDAGRVLVAGHRADGLPPHRVAALGVARTFQQLAVFPTMTAEENVLVGAHLRGRGGVVRGMLGVPDGLDRREARALLEAVGLTGREGEPALALSYGQRKRLELARALALRPVLLLLDEPAAGRNEPEILELGRLLKRLRAGGLTILLVEHHMNFVLSLADTVTVLDEGRVVAAGPPTEVRRDPAVIDTYLGVAGG